MRWLAALLLLLPTFAWGQSAVQQSGSVTVNSLGVWAADHKLRRAGAATGEQSLQGVNPFAINDSKQVCGLSLTDAVTTGPYNRFCLGHDSSSNAVITVTSLNGLADKTLKLNINGNLYDVPFAGAGSGNVVGPLTSSVNEIVAFNNTTGTLLKTTGWLDDGTRLLGPSGRLLTVAADGAFQAGGTTGPIFYAQAGFEDTMNVQAQAGALPSTDTTNFQLYPPILGGKAFVNITASAPLPNEERLIIGYNGSGTYIYTSFKAAGGVAHPQCFIDGTGADTTMCLRPRGGGVGTYPFVDLGPNVGLYGSNLTIGQQQWLAMDSDANLSIAAGGSIPTIIFRQPIATVHSGSPATLGSCGGGTPVIIGDATAGFVTVGTGATTACTVGFGFTYVTQPKAIILTGHGTGSTVLSVSAKTTTSFTVAASASFAEQSFSYFVVQ